MVTASPTNSSPPVDADTAAKMGTTAGLTDEQKGALYKLWAMVIHTLVHHGPQEGTPHALQESLRSLDSLHTSELASESSLQMMQSNPLSEEFWSQAGSGDIDGLVLRFLRARKWHVDAAYEMLIQCLKWRREVGVRKIMHRGEAGLKARLLHSGESYFWKHDREGRLAIVMRGRLHERSAQTLPEMIAFTIYQIETGRRLMDARQDTVTLVFDLGDASLSSFDYGSIQFIVQALQSYYPECLGKALVVNAPWLFSGFWRLIRPLLDQVVASKIHFLTAEQMLDHFDAENLQKCYGGTDAYEYKYEPLPAERQYLAPLTEAEWQQLQLQIETDKVRLVDVTLKLAQGVVAELEAERDERKASIFRAHSRLDQHTLARTHYHRLGVLSDCGTVNWPSE